MDAARDRRDGARDPRGSIARCPAPAATVPPARYGVAASCYALERRPPSSRDPPRGHHRALEHAPLLDRRGRPHHHLGWRASPLLAVGAAATAAGISVGLAYLARANGVARLVGPLSPSELAFAERAHFEARSMALDSKGQLIDPSMSAKYVQYAGDIIDKKTSRANTDWWKIQALTIERFQAHTKSVTSVRDRPLSYMVKHVRRLLPAVVVALSGCGSDGSQLLDGPVTVDATLVDAATATDAVAPPHFDLYADPVNGLDTNPGTLAQPVATLTRVAKIATSGQTIGLLDGTFREGAAMTGCDGRRILVPGGLTFRSVNPRAASISNISFGVTSGSLSIIDLSVDGTCTGIEDSSPDAGATLTVTGVQFRNGGNLVLSGDVKATVTQGSLVGILSDARYGGFATLTQSAELVLQGVTIDGGATTTQCNNPLLQVENASNLTLDGVTVKNFSGAGIFAAQTSQILLENHTVLDHVAYVGGCSAAIIVNAAGSGLESTTLTIQDSAIQNSFTTGIALRSAALATVKLTNSVLTGLAAGIRFNGSEGSAVDLDIVGSQITQNTQIALDLRPSSSSALHVTVQSSTITGNANGLALATGPGSTVDLTGNTIQSAGTGITLDGTTAITANALGNTWAAGQQGADAAGHYPDGTLVTSVNAAGSNYKIVNGSTLDL